VLNYYLKINDYLWNSFQVQYEIAVQDHFRQITVDAKAEKLAREKLQKHIKKMKYQYLRLMKRVLGLPDICLKMQKIELIYRNAITELWMRLVLKV
jgi:hypothetical protein